MEAEFSGARVCIIANYNPSAGGISGQVDLLNKSLKSEGADVRIVSTKSNPVLKPLVFIKVLLVSRRYRILHIHGCSWFGFLPIIIGITAGKLLHKRAVVTYHGGHVDLFLNRWGFLAKPFLRSAESITVPSGYMKTALEKHGINSTVVPNILDIGRFPYKERNGVTSKLLIVKHLEDVYNVEMGIRAFKQVKESFPDAELRIVGSGSLEKELKVLVEGLGLKDSIIFLGSVDHQRINKVYGESDIFLNCSRAESFGMVILEAMASGLPVVSTNVGGIPDIVKDGVTGFLVESDDSKGMAEKVLYLLRNSKKSSSVSEEGRNSAEKYSWGGIKSQLRSLYLGA